MRALLAMALLAVSCTDVSVMKAQCTSDSQCGPGQICFLDGCGDPGKGLFVEVSTSAGGGAQDFSVGSLEGNQTLQLAPPAFIKGSVSQPGSVVGSLVPYASKVDLTAIGQSALIPGVTRAVTASINLGAVGPTFQLPVATGVYDLSVTPQDLNVPPQIVHAITVQPGDQPFEQIILTPYGVGTSTVKKATVNLSYPNTTATSSHAFVAQAFDTVTGDPLSEPTPVSVVGSVDAGNGNGNFDLFVGAGSPLASAFTIVLTPVDPNSAPTNVFVIPWNANLIGLSLAMGDYGSPVAATGRLVDQSGLAVAQAEVFIQGKVSGGGDYRSATAISGPDGTFTVQTLASATDGSGDLTLFALPPIGVSAGATAVPVVVGLDGGVVGDVPCPSRLLLNGLLRNPDGTPASNAAVSATLVTALLGTTALGSLPQTTTDPAGSFSMFLDPGFYRLDFIPGDTRVPHGSWFWPTGYSVDAGVGGIDSPIYTLSEGRTLHGTITQQSDPSSGQRPVSGASVTFFRVSNVQGLPVSFPLAQTTANTDGTFSVLLPTAPDAGF